MKLNTKAKLVVAAVAATMMLGGASSAQAATPVSPSLPAVGHIYCWETGDYIWLTETSASWTKQDGATLKTVPRAQYDAVAPSQEWRLTANGCVFYPRGGTVGGQPHK